MTTHFIDLRVLPDPETGPAQLLGALYDRLHLALVRHRRDDIGVSFPHYSLNPRALGSVLRLHGTAEALRGLMDTAWLGGVRDHVRIGELAPAPPHAEHRTLQRRQFKTSVERLRRRRMQRKGETAEQAAHAIPESVQRQPDLPYVHLRSSSTAQPFCLFLARGPLREQPVPGPFNSHGLSSTTTVPWF
ncbi:type I-F CRISPR-associated endoribonuclease Cas6/Csy4 [Pseudoxanthomonas sp. UC19_8]|uniref:type I-F CRISPR-associated endoribonuclease Cas6/Csy4 n=1 Tax=Pseudoxanthomonas sp. UC19_8 TaxID=3350175 RepID=UPI0036D3014A